MFKGQQRLIKQYGFEMLSYNNDILAVGGECIISIINNEIQIQISKQESIKFGQYKRIMYFYQFLYLVTYCKLILLIYGNHANQNLSWLSCANTRCSQTNVGSLLTRSLVQWLSYYTQRKIETHPVLIQCAYDSFQYK